MTVPDFFQIGQIQVIRSDGFLPALAETSREKSTNKQESILFKLTLRLELQFQFFELYCSKCT